MNTNKTLLFNVKRLAEKRIAGGRPEKLEDMTREQLLQEKVAVQKGLLHLEGTHGRPTSKDERDIVRPLYDRYRTLKRLLVRNAPVIINTFSKQLIF